MQIQDRFKELFVISACGSRLINKVSRGNNGLCIEGQFSGHLNKINGHRSVRVDGKSYPESKVIWAMHFGSLPTKVLHKNGDPLDNRIENLYIASDRKKTLAERRALQGYEELSKVFDYDEKNGVVKWKRKRGSREAGAVAGCIDSSKGYVKVSYRCVSYGCHRIAWLLYYGKWPDGEIDHINGNRADNRIENLRDIPASEQAKNCKLNNRNRTGVCGVSLKRGKYWAVIGNKGSRISLGTFDSMDEAVMARAEAEKNLGFHPNHGRR